MLTSADAWRRWFGLLFLALAFGLLVWGQTVLREKLDGLAFLIYWASCFVFTFAAMITALLDLRVMRKRAREEKARLLRNALEKIESDSREGAGE